MVFNMSKKNAPLPRRPEPPGVKAIIEDIEGAPSDDPVFNLLDNRENDSMSSSLLGESAFSCDEPATPQAKPASTKTRGDKESNSSSIPDIETMYRQATQFLELNEKLKNAPEKLQKQCEDLQETGKELKATLDSLRSQSYSGAGSSQS